MSRNASKALGLRTRAATAAIVLLLAACATAKREPWVLTSDDLRGHPRADLEHVSSYPQALATAGELVERDVGLPALEVRLLFLPDKKQFKAVLVRIGYPARLANEVVRQMIAVGGHRTVMINQGWLERAHRDWPGRVSFLAHELGHVLQYAVGGGKRGTSAQWLREGFAEWLEMRVREAYGRTDAATARTQAASRIRSHSRVPVMSFGGPDSMADFVEQTQGFVRVPPLAALTSWPDWVAQSRGGAGPVLPDYAFVAVSVLVEQHGAAALVRYFTMFAQREDTAAIFVEVFGEPEEDFERRVKRVVWP